MKTIENIQNLSLSELLLQLNSSDEQTFVSDMDLYMHLQKITDDFNPKLLQIAMDGIVNFWWNCVLYVFEGEKLSFIELEHKWFERNESYIKWRKENKKDGFGIIVEKIILGFTDNQIELKGLNTVTAEERIELDETTSEFDGEVETGFSWYINSGNLRVSNKEGLTFYRRYLNLAFDEFINRNSIDELIKWLELREEYNIETANYPSDHLNSNLKRPQNTLKKQIALLEHTGVIDYLTNKYGKNDSKLSELISNILNRDKQNIRQLISFSSTKDSQSSMPENKNFIDNLFNKIEG
jgi:hypothetical protein